MIISVIEGFRIQQASFMVNVAEVETRRVSQRARKPGLVATGVRLAARNCLGESARGT
jgi:hypothetical protein